MSGTGPRWAVERAVAACRNAEGCVAIADDISSAHLRWAGNALTTNGFTRTQRLTVIAVAGDAAGVVAREGGLDRDSVAELVQAAECAARLAGPAPDAAPLPTGDGRDPPGWSDPPAETTFARLHPFITGLTHLFDDARQHGRELYGYAEQQVRTTYLASTTGLRLRHRQPTGILDLTAPAGHGTPAWTGLSVPDLTQVRLAAPDTGPTRTVDLPPGRYEVLLPPSAVADLMIHLYRAAAAADTHTVFGDGTRLGERLTEAPLTLYGDPHEPGLECAPFAIARSFAADASVFDNGTPLRRTEWITGGVLTSLVRTRSTAGATGLPHTPMIDNLVLSGPGGRTLADMIAGTRRALLPTSLWYLRDVEPRTLLLTGVTRDGVLLIEDGEITGRVPDFRFNESPVALLDRVTEAGRTERTLPREWGDYFTRTAMPPLRIADFAVSAFLR